MQPFAQSLNMTQFKMPHLRFFIIANIFLAATGIYITRSVINIALVAMVDFDDVDDRGLLDWIKPHMPEMIFAMSYNSTAVNVQPDQLNNNKAHHYDSLMDYINKLSETKFKWDVSNSAYIQSAFFLGYVFLQIPAASFANNYGGRPFMLLAVLLSALISLAAPSIAGNEWIFIASRFLLGVAQSCFIPSCFVIFVRWLPLRNKSFAISTLGAASQLGTVSIYFASGFISTRLGWPYLFWIGGLYALVIVCIVFWFVTSNPEEHPLITPEELIDIRSEDDEKEPKKDHIEGLATTSALDCNGNEDIGTVKDKDALIGKSKEKPSTPWRQMLTNKAVLVTFFFRTTHTAVGMLNYNFLPLFLKTILNLSPEVNGIFNAFLAALSGITGISLALISEKLIEKKVFARTTARRFFACIDGFGRAACLAFIPIAVEYSTVPVVLSLITLSVFTSSFISASESPIPAEMSKNYGHAIFAILNVCAMMTGSIVPNAVSLVLHAYDNGAYAWYIVHYIAAAMITAATIPFVIWASADRQDFDFPDRPVTRSERERTVSVDSFVFSST